MSKSDREPGSKVSFDGTPLDIARLERLSKEYQTRSRPGGFVPRTVAARSAMLVGLDKIEADFGLPPLKLKRPKRTRAKPVKETATQPAPERAPAGNVRAPK